MSKDKKIRSFTHLKKKNIKKSNLFEEDCVSDIEDLRESHISIKFDKEKEEKEKEKEKDKK